jgi:hypothetical protein
MNPQLVVPLRHLHPLPILRIIIIITVIEPVWGVEKHWAMRNIEEFSWNSKWNFDVDE